MQHDGARTHDCRTDLEVKVVCTNRRRVVDIVKKPAQDPDTYIPDPEFFSTRAVYAVRFRYD